MTVQNGPVQIRHNPNGTTTITFAGHWFIVVNPQQARELALLFVSIAEVGEGLEQVRSQRLANVQRGGAA